MTIKAPKFNKELASTPKKNTTTIEVPDFEGEKKKIHATQIEFDDMASEGFGNGLIGYVTSTTIPATGGTWDLTGVTVSDGTLYSTKERKRKYFSKDDLPEVGATIHIDTDIQFPIDITPHKKYIIIVLEDVCHYTYVTICDDAADRHHIKPEACYIYE